jgi:hypothetical protein
MKDLILALPAADNVTVSLREME